MSEHTVTMLGYYAGSYTVTFPFNNMPDQWVVEDSPVSAQVHRLASGRLYCWLCSAEATCVHCHVVWKWMEEHGWFEEVVDETE